MGKKRQYLQFRHKSLTNPIVKKIEISYSHFYTRLVQTPDLNI